MIIDSPIDGRQVSSRRRIIYDSLPVTAATETTLLFFVDPAGKNRLQMDPLIDSRLANNQRMIVQALALAFPRNYDFVEDVEVLDQVTVRFRVQDNRVESSKLEGLPRNFPAGGGIDGVFASGDATGDIDQQNFNNGTPEPNAMFFFDDMPIVIEEQVTFVVEVDIPAAIANLTTGRWYVKLIGAFEFLTVAGAKQQGRGFERRLVRGIARGASVVLPGSAVALPGGR